MIARGGISLVTLPAVAIGILLASAIVFSDETFVFLTLPFGLIFIIFLIFFRDPARKIGRGIVAPADGRVVEAEASGGRVSIYMGIFDVHVNRAPWSGLITGRRRHAGTYAIASSKRATENCSVDWHIGTLIGSIRLRQIAGVFARRIVPYVDEGARIKKGQRIGLIRFGSRVELILPPKTRIVVAVGDRVRAGETTIAEVEHGFAEENPSG